MQIKQITLAIGAEVSEVHLGEAARNPELFAEVKSALLKHKVLFFRNQDITRGDHVAFASCFGKLEDHPVVNSDPKYPGLGLIYAARSLTPSIDARFRASINSFHRLSQQEAAAAHPQRIEIVEAQDGDTPETMAKKMAITDRPIDQFLALNGLEKDAVLKPGLRYKIIVE